MNDSFDPAFARGLTESRFSRRRLLRTAGAGVAGAGLIGFLEACGIAGTRGTGAQNVNWSVFWAQQRKAGVLDWANWPLYIDSAHGGDHPSIDLFTKQTGIERQLQGRDPGQPVVLRADQPGPQRPGSRSATT